MSDYTPSIAIARHIYATHASGSGASYRETTAEFQRLVRRIRAEALREFANYYAENPADVDDETPADLRNEMRRWADRTEDPDAPTA